MDFQFFETQFFEKTMKHYDNIKCERHNIKWKRRGGVGFRSALSPHGGQPIVGNRGGAQRRPHGAQKKGPKGKGTIFIDGCPSMNTDGFPVL